MRKWHTDRRALLPSDGGQETEGGGEAVGTGKLERSSVSFCRLDGTCAVSRIPPTNSLALRCAHGATIPIRAGQVSPVCLHARFGNDIYSLSVVWPEVSLFLSPLLLFHDSIKNYDSLQEVKAFFKNGLSQEQPCTHCLPHTVLEQTLAMVQRAMETWGRDSRVGLQKGGI